MVVAQNDRSLQRLLGGESRGRMEGGEGILGRICPPVHGLLGLPLPHGKNHLVLHMDSFATIISLTDGKKNEQNFIILKES